MSHRRYNPLLDEWVLCSPGRLKRPWLGQRDTASTKPPSYDPDCYMCPGNVRASGEHNPSYTDVFVFDNDYPALSPADESDSLEPGASSLFRAEPAPGRCRVVCFSPHHDRHLGTMTPAALARVVDTWAEQTERFVADDDARFVQVFENRGPMMGASNPHPHGQMWGSAHIPSIPWRKTRQQDEYFREQGKDLLGDYLEQEIRRDERVVEANDHWVQLVPFWAVWPFETMLIPRRRVEDLAALDDVERSALGAMLGKLTRRYDALFDTPFPYSMGWYQSPHDGVTHHGRRLHAVYLPPLVRSATVRKFLVGYELTSEPQRDLTPEHACERLRACSTA